MNAAKIYIGENLLLLAEKDIRENLDWEKILQNPSDTAISSLVKQLQNGLPGNVLLTSDQFDSLFNAFSKHFKIVKAAGGLVIHSNNDILLILRRGKWDLPKGKLDEGETIEACALREVSEETGLSDVSITQFLDITRHLYQEKDEMILKETHWFEMAYRGSEKPIPQIEEDIEMVKWVSIGELVSYLKNTYPSIKEILMQWQRQKGV